MISNKAKIGKNVTIGNYCVIEDDVEIGDNTIIKNFVELRNGTVIGKNCYIDSRVSTSGDCKIGNDVTLRYSVIIARGVEVGDGSYLCPRVMTNNLNDKGDGIGGAKIGKNCFVGTNSVLQYGIKICDNTIMGSLTFASKDIFESGTYVGIPAKKIK